MKRIILLLTFAAVFSVNAFSQKQPPPKPDASESRFAITIEHDGQKTEIVNTQFQTADGNASAEGAQNGRILLFYGASNDKDEKSFSFQGWVPRPEKGVFTNENGAGLNFMTSLFSNVPMFIPKTMTVEITAMPLRGGYVEGTFTAVCDNVRDDGSVETYNLSGSFRVKRMN
ncbi:MAG: hypothetical protein JSS81_23835 [Acidobacteria bacterium]|nr:hypothetical protein [Acidobacteriota bacterium]